jgi:hypothetical protein
VLKKLVYLGMEFTEDELIHAPVYFNEKYDDRTTYALHRVEIAHNIEKIDFINKNIVISISVVFTDKLNADIIANADVSMIIRVELRNNKDSDDFNRLYLCLSNMISEVKEILLREIPPDKIGITPPLIIDYEIKEVVSAVLLELKGHS